MVKVRGEVGGSVSGVQCKGWEGRSGVRWDGHGIYLVQVPPGISQEGDGMARPHADGYGSEAG